MARKPSACANQQPQTNTGAGCKPAPQSLVLACGLCQREAQTILHLLKATRALHEVCEVTFAVNAPQGQPVTELVVEPFFDGYCRALARAPHGQTRASIAVAIRITEVVNGVTEFRFEPVFRFDQLAL